MKAWLYAVETANGWEARMSIAWEVDVAYWREKGDGWFGKLRVPLPLGWAELAREALERELGREKTVREVPARNGSSEWAVRRKKGMWTSMEGRTERDEMARQQPAGRKGSMRTAAEMEGELIRAAREACGPEGDMLLSGCGVDWQNVKARGEAGEAGGMVRDLTRSGVGGSGERDRCENASSESAFGDAALEALAAVARQAGECLRGRSLLREEAAAMLAAAAPALPGEPAALLRALQLAALRGDVRLAAALEPAAAPAAGRRSRRQGRLRCRRCGSGEERMRRTGCASCGRSGCAVCEACASLGRSRECGLLVLGARPSEQPLALAPGESMDRWGLSPAQRDASAAAVRFLREGRAPAAPAAGRARAIPRGQARRPERSARRALAALRRMTPGLSAFRRLAPRLSAFLRSANAEGRTHHPMPAAAHPRLQSPRSDGIRESKSPASAMRLLSLLRPAPSPRETYDRSFLLWAVTGAGKTEMIFPLLAAVLEAGGRALVATPRKDVVLELAPRLAKAFPGHTRAVLYGGSEDRWENAALTMATTHQLFRFQEAFDLVLIDELDAFPYHGDPLLHYAAAKSRKKTGTTVLLSATPPGRMQRAVRRGELACARVPVRYHRHPLPVPRRLALPPMNGWLAKRRLPAALRRRLEQSLARGAQLFVFVPYIKHVSPMVELLRARAGELRVPAAAIDGTSSADPRRADKVVSFRNKAIRLLVTTTILERGVTIPRSDVFILDAQQGMFDEAALVQMAGRAGRSGDDPHGSVFFGAAYRTRAQRGAERQIRAMNRIARSRGYLRDKEG